MASFGELRLGRIVAYFDASGNMKPAIVTAIRDGVAGKVRLSIFEPGGTLTDADNVLFKAQGAPSTWRPFGVAVDALA